MVPPLHARVSGAGPTGALASLALAAAGWTVTLHDPLTAEHLRQRSRAYAFTHSSRRLLQRLALWQELLPWLTPFGRLRLQDQGAQAGVVFDTRDLGRRLAEEPDAAVGWIGLHEPLMALLLHRLQTHPGVRLQLGGTTSEAGDVDLVVAADGPYSPTRTSLGIGTWGWTYRQACLTVQVELRGPEAGEAWELLRPEGPFAVLPLGERRYQLVWSAPQARCRQLESLPEATFLDALAGALPDSLQPDALLDEPRAFPVALQLARRLHRGRTVLVGESAHRCHPVGGQGLNLGWRDVEVLHGLAERAARGRLDPARLGSAYGWRRWPDLLLTLLATDLLMRLFSNRQPLLLPLRRLALRLLSRGAPLRRLSLGVMTHGACRPVGQRAQ
jgi:2-octaprenyl-6-methoxyphenol hydroxylase